MLLGPRLRASGVQVVRRFGEVGPVVCRAGEINQVFMNLLVNALQALEGTDRGRGRGWPDHHDRDLARMATPPRWPSRTTGRAFRPGLEKRIFDPFFTTKPRGQGTGLGLSISSDIARRHGGSLVVEAASAAGSGARFVCRLPSAAAPTIPPHRSM